jgi:choline kinase
VKLILLAAGKSSRIYKEIKLNKCLIKIGKLSLIERIIKNATDSGIDQIITITGFKPENIKGVLRKNKFIKYIHNKKFSNTDMVYSAMLGLKNAKSDVIISYTDIIYDRSLFELIKKNKLKKITVPYIKSWKKVWNSRKKNIYADAETFKKNKNGYLTGIGNKITKKNINKVDGQFMGIIYIPKEEIAKILEKYFIKKKFNFQFTQFLNYLINLKFKIKCVQYKSYWYEIDDLEDLNNFKKQKNFFK